MKKIIFYPCIIIFVICNLWANAQERYYSKVYFSPLGLGIGRANFDEVGLGVYKFNMKQTNLVEGGVILGRQLIKNLYGEVGLSLRSLKYKFDFVITDPFDENLELLRANRYENKFMIVPHLGFRYGINKFSVSLGIESNLEISSSGNIETQFSSINLFIDPGTNRTAYFSFEERDFFLKSLSLFLAPVGDVSYQISPKVSTCLRFTFKPYGNFYLYQLRIQGKTADMPDGNHILNDSRINNKLMFLNLGVSYSL
ncbi:MAG: hypothetical protein ABJB16_08750 [Saprospiraceae bacterium]